MTQQLDAVCGATLMARELGAGCRPALNYLETSCVMLALTENLPMAMFGGVLVGAHTVPETRAD